jgi:hypothetical protein
MYMYAIPKKGPHLIGNVWKCHNKKRDTCIILAHLNMLKEKNVMITNHKSDFLVLLP